MRVRLGAAALSLLPAVTIWTAAAFGQSPRAKVAVPFVGCRTVGQASVIEPPTGADKALPLNARDARSLAYYESTGGLHVLAPRGWYCDASWGSGGIVLVVSPQPIDVRSPGWEYPEDPVVEIDNITSGASGAYDIARIAARVLPKYRRIALEALQEFDLPVPTVPYPKDVLRYTRNGIVEYVTPANTEGLGTQSFIKSSSSPITGTVIVDDERRYPGALPDLFVLSVRLPANLTRLTRAILDESERGVR